MSDYWIVEAKLEQEKTQCGILKTKLKEEPVLWQKGIKNR